MWLCLPIIRIGRWEHSILARGELVDPFDRHRGPTDVSHFFTLPLFDGTPLFSQKSTPKPIGRFRTHVIMSRFTNGCFADRSFLPFRGVWKTLRRTARKHRSRIAYRFLLLGSVISHHAACTVYPNEFSQQLYSILKQKEKEIERDVTWKSVKLFYYHSRIL